MDFSFTKDPEWIEQRERQWEEIEGPYRDGSTRKEVAAVKHYFMTGEKPGRDFGVATTLRLFPAFTVEGIQYCLSNYMPPSVSDEQYISIQQVFVLMNGVMGITIKEKQDLFEFVFGKVYDSERQFPFLLGEEPRGRLITVHVNYLFSVGVSPNRYIRTNNPSEKTHWLYLLEYFFSLIPYVDSRVFYDVIEGEGTSHRYYNLRHIRSKLDCIVSACFTLPEPSENPDDDRERVAYLNEFRDRMENLGKPIELKRIWEAIKAKYQ